jgi:Tol biopolymer transport system component
VVSDCTKKGSPLKEGSLKSLLANRRLTLDESANAPFSWTPDSKTVLLSSDRNGTSEIFKQATDQRLAENLMAGAEDLWQPRLTSDGSEILYVSTPQSSSSETLSSIFAIPVIGGTPRLILQDIGIRNVQCARLPSTICLYSMYSSTKGNSSETFRFDVRSGKTTLPSQIDPECNWSLSPDGSQRAIVAIAPNQGTIRLRSTSTGKTHDLVVKGWNGLRAIDWSADGKSLLVSWGNEQDSALLSVTLEGKASVLLHSSNYIEYSIPSPGGRYRISDDRMERGKNASKLEELGNMLEESRLVREDTFVTSSFAVECIS